MLTTLSPVMRMSFLVVGLLAAPSIGACGVIREDPCQQGTDALVLAVRQDPLYRGANERLGDDYDLLRSACDGPSGTAALDAWWPSVAPDTALRHIRESAVATGWSPYQSGDCWTKEMAGFRLALFRVKPDEEGTTMRFEPVTAEVPCGG